MLYLAYSFLLSVMFLVLSPYFLYRAFRTGKYIRGFRQRLGFIPAIQSKQQGRPTIWIHAVSVGETLAVQPLVEKLQASLGPLNLVISTTTDTGQTVARSKYAHIAEIVYFPFDWKFSVKRAIERIGPTLAVVVESEIWPNFLRACRQRGVPVILVSGRISKRSYERYRLVGPLLSQVLQDFRFLLMQTEEHTQRVLELGGPPDRVISVGSLKWDAELPQDEAETATKLDHLLGLSETKYLIVAGSTAKGEEEIILNSFKQIKDDVTLSDARLLIAPRKPDRFDEVEKLLQQSGLRHARRTRVGQREEGQGAEVILLDTIGELPAVYQFADVVFVGGTVFERGGHNVVEPVLRGAVVVVGLGYCGGGVEERVVQRLSDAGSRFSANTALIHNLTAVLRRILLDDQLRRQILLSASEMIQRNRGVTQTTIEYLQVALFEKEHSHAAQSFGE